MKPVLNALGKPLRQVIEDEKGQPIILNARLQRLCDVAEEHIKNALGFDIPITTMTTIARKITEQKFFEIAPADYLPIKVGQGAWSDVILTYREFTQGDNFETGIINMAQENARLANADAAVDSVPAVVNSWAKSTGWNLVQLEMAAKAGNWDLVAAKERGRKKNWDLGVQRLAFLGLNGSNQSGGSIFGLLNMPGITNNTTIISKLINTMDTAELKQFISRIIQAYRVNCNYTAWPTHFIIPEDDWNGLASQASPDFPVISTLKLLENAFKEQVPGGKFKAILPLAYGIPANNSQAGLNVHRYVMLNYDEESLRMDIPVDYTTTVPNSLDNFTLQNVGYGQFTGVVPYRPKETMYFSF